MRKSKKQSELLDLASSESREISQQGLIMGASTDDILAMLETGILLDPRLRRGLEVDETEMTYNPLPFFEERVETWFEHDVVNRKTPGHPVGVVFALADDLITSLKGSRSPQIAYRGSNVTELVFRSSEEHGNFHDNLLTFGLEGQLNPIRTTIDPNRFGAESTSSQIKTAALPIDYVLNVEKVLRMTSAIAVSVAARRDRRSTSHVLRLIKGAFKRGPSEEFDNDAPLLDGILHHRNNAKVEGGSIEQLIVKWSDAICEDDDRAPMTVSSLLLKLEEILVSEPKLDPFVAEANRRFTSIREIVSGTSPFDPFSINKETEPLSRVLDALQLFVMRRSPLDLLEMPRKDHTASIGVFMLAAYWSGLSIPRTRLNPRISSQPLRRVLVDLEVKCLSSTPLLLPSTMGMYRVELDDSEGHKPFDFQIDGILASEPFGSSWRVDVLPSHSDRPMKSDRKMDSRADEEVVAEYPLGDHEVAVRNGKIIVTRKVNVVKAPGKREDPRRRDR